MAAGNLVVVESVAKARTIQKFLGRSYTVRACVGHVRDLPKSGLGVDDKGDFTPRYIVPREKKEVVKQLKEQAKSSKTIYLATDPDREGEAIAWHLVAALGLEGKPVHRIEFHEIVKDAVLQALAHPRDIDQRRVDAQQARRVLDRLVGYRLSPLLWQKVKRGLSAGRVQSVAVRLIVDREREIEAFQSEEYWSVHAELTRRAPLAARAKLVTFRAGLVERDGRGLEPKVDLADEEQVQAIVASLEGAAYDVRDVRRREQLRHPSAPFTTSTLQQEASRKLGFTAKRTMAVAQQLYEGVDLGSRETIGLITYMRTDSVNVAESAIAEARAVIAERFSPEMVPTSPRQHQTRSRLAQEAHEAVRPTSAQRDPARVRQYLTTEQFRLYDLVWKRFIASQMASAVFDVTTVDVLAQTPGQPSYLFRASGSIRKFDGFLKLYEEGQDDAAADAEGKQRLPELTVGELLDLVQLHPEQHFTQPPPRYSEATLVKALEEKGVGRPSTYAPILSTIQERGYVQRIERRLHPTELGTIVNTLLVTYFPDVVDADFTANMEEKLDDVARGERPWVPIIREFYQPFDRTVTEAAETVPKMRPPDEITDERCEKCDRPMAIKLGRFGRFLACTGFPECRNAKKIVTKVGVDCPECGGDLVERQTKARKLFYGCANFPECNFGSWQKPVADRCPVCGGLQVIAAKDRLRCIKCEPLPSKERENGKGSVEPSTAPRRTIKAGAKTGARGTARTSARGKSASAKRATSARTRSASAASPAGRRVS
ncbi:MAG: type I DNA topoisomerase [Chloroflexi bacterium]|nr:type I DNA topoisomerase [Chloroflexota bacterium]